MQGRQNRIALCRLNAQTSLEKTGIRLIEKWGVQDSNLRRHCHQIYSLTPLTARETPQTILIVLKKSLLSLVSFAGAHLKRIKSSRVFGRS